MRKIVLIIVAVLGLCACSETEEQYTLMTYNVGVFSKYKDNSAAEVAALIKESGACLVALNELDSCNRRHGNFQLKDLAKELGGWNYHFASAFPYAGGAYGNGVVSREPVLANYSISLPRFDGAEPRSCAVVETDRCVFGAVHLDHKGDSASIAQARVLSNWFNARYSGSDKPVFLCGDMNCVPEGATITELLKEWNLLSGTGYSFPSTAPRKCIDYIFALKSAASVQTLSAAVLTEAGDASDHLPVTVLLK